MTTTQTINVLPDNQAITVLTLILEHQGRLPDPTRLRQLDTQAAQAAQDPDLAIDVDVDVGVDVDTAEAVATVTPGDLARTTLTYLHTTRPDLTPVIDHAITLTTDGPEPDTRVDPLTAGIGALVILALQTEIQLERITTGTWRFKIHKKALTDTTLRKLLTQLITSYTSRTGQ